MSRIATRPQARRGDGARLRSEIVDATRKLLVDSGDAERVSMRAIAGSVGVTPPSIYRHFATKDDLLEAVCEGLFARLDAETSEAAARHRDPVDALAARGRAYIQFGLSHPEEYRLLFMTKTTFGAGDAAERMRSTAAFGHLVEAVRTCIEAGRIDRRHDPVTVAIGLWCTMHGLVSLLIVKPQFPWPPIDDLVNHVVQTACAGVATVSPGG